MKQKVLFLCTGNSARSQMAEGLLRHMAGDRFEVFSAGTRPVGLNPLAVEAMKEVGIDISQHRSKGVEEFSGRPFDYVITVCDRARESCPIWTGGSEMQHWGFEDPATAAGLEEDRRRLFRRVRDDMVSAIARFILHEAKRGAC